MEVFALGLKLKEEGAATVQAATQRLNTELNRTSVAADKAAKAVQTAQLNASKGALAFGGMARSMAQTGSAASLMSGGIVEAGTHIATFLGPQGILLMAVTGLVVAVRNAFKTMREDVEREVANLQNISLQIRDATFGKSLEELMVGDTKRTAADVKTVVDAVNLGLRRVESTLGGLSRLSTRYSTELSNLSSLAEQNGALSFEQADRVTFLRTEIARITEQVSLFTEAQTNLRRAIANTTTEIQQQGVTATQLALPAIGAATTRLPQIVGAPAEFKAQLQPLTGGISGAAAEEARKLQNNLRETFAEGIGNGITDGIAAGFERGFASGNIGEGFKALAGTMLSGLGSAMIQFGKASLVASTLMQKIRDSLSALSPKGAVVASLAMIAAGGALRGVAQSAFGGMGGGGGMAVVPTTPFGIPMTGAAMGPTQLIFGATSATTAAGMTPRQAMNVTLIGPNDPTAQRAMQELMRNANQRGSLG